MIGGLVVWALAKASHRLFGDERAVCDGCGRRIKPGEELRCYGATFHDRPWR